MKKKNNVKDPHQQREAEKYDNPIPSREFIIAHLEQRNGPATHPELSKELALFSEENIEALRRRLIAMVRDGQLHCTNRGAYGLIDKLDLVRGRVQGHADGHGFLIPDQGGKDFYLNYRQMRGCFHGDVVLARKGQRDHRGRTEAIITEVLERNTEELVGRFRWEGAFGVVHAENKRITHDILIPPADVEQASDGDIVVVSIVEQPAFRKQPIGKVTKVMGAHMAPGMEIDIALRSYEIPHEWHYEVEAQVVGLTEEVSEADKADRIDLRELAFVTIDGEDARDFDDAVFAKTMRNGNIKLYVAIADVSHYVAVDTPLDHEARNRATSVYFPERVIPMLPEILSNGLCSLNPHTDRLSLVCEMEVNEQGEVLNFKFMEGVIHSHARLTYTLVGEFLEDDSGAQEKLFTQQFGAAVVKNIETLNDVYQRFRIARSERGAIEYETRETRIVFDDDRKIDRIVPTERNEAHRLIEECMLAANVSAATFLETLKIPCLYRVHDTPSFEKLENLRSYMGEQGLALSGGFKPTAKDYQKLLQQISHREDFHLLQTVMLRSMAQAVYQPDNIGHFGLAFERYAHFTSPIRRYPDLLVHRAIRSIVRSKKRTPMVRRMELTQNEAIEKNYPYDVKAMLELGEQCSMAERRADEATWDVMAWLKCEFMSGHIGEEYTGTISSVTNFGLFVQLDDIYVDGLVHISSLQSDYYQYQEAGHRLVGERTRKTYKLGDSLKIRVMRVDLDERKIDFELADVAAQANGGGKAKKGKPSRPAKGRDKASKPKTSRPKKSKPEGKKKSR